jgi:hypothetical protein
MDKNPNTIGLIFDYEVQESPIGIDVYSNGTHNYILTLFGKSLADFFSDTDNPTEMEKVAMAHEIDNVIELNALMDEI